MADIVHEAEDCEQTQYMPAAADLLRARQALGEGALWDINQARNARIGWAKLDYRLVQAGILTVKELAVYVSLCSHCGKAGRLDPGVRRMAKELSIRPASVIKALKGLERLGIISIFKRGGHHSSAYALHDIADGNQGRDDD